MKSMASLVACAAAIGLTFPHASAAEPALSQEEANEIAHEAFIYAYPLVLSRITFLVGTNTETPNSFQAPVNQLAHMREFPDPKFTIVVRPNADTLYSVLTYDVTREPLVVTVPPAGDRYFLMPWLDMWSDIFTVPGSRTTGNAAQTYAIVGPRWRGTLPDGIREYRSPTGQGLLIGRTQTNGKADYAAVHKFQDGMQAVPLSAYGKPYTPSKGTVNPDQDMSPPPDQIDNMSAETFFELFVSLLEDNPPHANDNPMLDRLRRIGIEPGKPFRLQDAPETVQKALNAAPKTALPQIKAAWTSSGVAANGWRTNLSAIGTYGTDYLHRAGVAYGGYGANSIEDAIYPTAFTDVDGQPFQSDRKYVLRFDRGQTPPVRGFWSLTMYDDKQLFAVNPIDRYAIGDRDKLAYNADGSLDLYIQRESPGKAKESNWLPTPPAGTFTMNLRLYWPKAEALQGRWKPPAVMPVK